MRLEKADYPKWIIRDLWKLFEGISLLLGVEPDEKMVTLPQANSRRNPKDISDFGRDYLIFYRLATDAMDLGLLNAYESSEYRLSPNYRRFYPYEFLEWAQSKHCEISEELRPALSRPTPSNKLEPPKWGYRYDTRLLKVARNVVDQFWEDVPLKETSNKQEMIEILMDRYTLSKNEAEAIDLITRHDKLRKGRGGYRR